MDLNSSKKEGKSQFVKEEERTALQCVGTEAEGEAQTRSEESESNPKSPRNPKDSPPINPKENEE